MAKLLLVRIAGALAATSLAVVFVGLVPFLAAAPSAGARLIPDTAGVTVNRQFKGDRLPVVSPTNSAISRNEIRPRPDVLTRDNIPVGCDPAFSPVTDPRLANYYGRCAT